MREVSFPAESRLRSWRPTRSGTRGCGLGADVLHCPTFRGPFRSKAPLVVTVHDLAVLRHPEWFNGWTRRYSRLAVPRVVRAADRVIAVSEFTKRELVDLLGVPAAKIRVVPNAVEDVFTPEGPRAEGDYVLAVGTLEPRKNLARIAAAVDGELRVVGARGWGGVEPPANVTLARRGRRRGAGGALPRRPLPRLRLALRGLRHPRGRGARVRLPRGHEPRLADGGAAAPTPCSSTRSTWTRSARASRGRTRPRRARSPSWAEVARATQAVYEELCDSDRRRRARARADRATRRTSRTCCASCRGVAPDLRFAAVTRRPELVPEGVEPVELPARLQERAWPSRFRACCGELRPELAHFQYALPLGWRGRSVVTIHDLSFEEDGTPMGRLDRPSFATVVPRAARRADHVLTVSERTKRDVVARYGLPGRR